MENYKKDYLKVAMPLAMEGVFLVLLSSVDLIMIGRLGTEAINVVSIFVQPKMILLCMIRAFAMAVTIVITHKIATKKTKEIQEIFYQAIVMTVVGMGALHLLFFSSLRRILLFVGADKSYIQDAISYGNIMLVAVFIMSLSMMLQAILLGYKETKAVMKANVVGNCMTMISNACFIFGIGIVPRFGVKGAAIGNIIGSSLAFFYTICILWKKKLCYVPEPFVWIPKKKQVKEIGSIFSGILLEQGAERVGMVLYSKMAAGLGTVPFAVHSICMNVCDLYYNFAQGMGKASMVFAGQTIGSEKEEQYEAYKKTGITIGMIFSTIACCICFFFRKTILELYTSDIEVIKIGTVIMIFVAVVSFSEAQAMIAAGNLRGRGKTRQVASYSFVSITIIRPILTAVLIYRCNLGIYGAWISLVFDQTLRAVCASFLLKSQSQR